MLADILGSETAQKIFLHLFHYGETYGTAIANDFHMSLGQVQRQLDRFENAGVLVSKLVGRTRVYQFNPKSAYNTPFRELVRITYESILPEERRQIFGERRRPRRKGKPVIVNDD